MKRFIQGDYRGQSTLLPAKRAKRGRAKRGQIYFFLNKSVPFFCPSVSLGLYPRIGAVLCHRPASPE